MKITFPPWYVTCPFHPSCFHYPNNIRSKAHTVKIPCHVRCYILLLHHLSYAQVCSAKDNTEKQIRGDKFVRWFGHHCKSHGIAPVWVAFDITLQQNIQSSTHYRQTGVPKPTVIITESLSYLIVPQFPNYGLM